MKSAKKRKAGCIMSAISGVVNIHGESRRDIALAMQQAQKHRGPDDNDVFECADAAFSHARLSIIDKVGGHQPMLSESGKVVAMMDGEIYNFRTLREKLITRGHKFRTMSEIETVIHLYESYGSECLKLLDGMFAIAIFDINKRKLLLGRDRLGQKPLLYFADGDSLVFASEFSGLQQYPGFGKNLDKEALNNFMSLQYIPHPNTIYSGVRKLPPGHLLEQHLANNQISIRCYWKADFSIKNRELSFSSATSQLRKLVERAVEKRLASEVPIGTFLSGGVDSCIVTGITAKLMYPAPCDSFTAAFSDGAYDERKEAADSAEIINNVSGGNLRHHEELIAPPDFDSIKHLSAHFGEPFGDSSMIPLNQLSKFARKHISVALCGDGADEIFAGYERYLAMRYAECVYWIPYRARKIIFDAMASVFPAHGDRSKSGRIKRLLKLFAAKEQVGYFNLLDRCPQTLKKELYGSALNSVVNSDSSDCFTSLYWELISQDKVERLEELDLKTYLPGDALVKSDISSLANSLELRSPFLDQAVVEFASRLPMEYKLSAKRRKYILCAAFPEFITPEVLKRPKRGFGVPVASWLRSSWKKDAEKTLFEGKLISENFIKPDALRKYWNLHQSGRDFSYLLWNLLMLAFFLERRSQ